MEVKDKVYGAAIILLITFLGVQIGDSDNWFYCEAENNLKQCDSLSKYGVLDAKCIGSNGVNDICTAGGIKFPWKPLDDYLDINIKKEIVVESLQDCNLEYFNISEDILVECTKSIPDYNNCIDIDWINNSCNEWGKTYFDVMCHNGTRIIEKNRSICEPKGFNITYPDNSNYEITGECCGYFNESKQIVCKEEIGGVCNPVCQQSSVDPNVYDEYCMIYNIGDKNVVPELVGKYDYVENYQVKLSDFKVKLK